MKEGKNVQETQGAWPATRHTVEISGSVLATIQRRAIVAPKITQTVAAFDVIGESEAN